MLINIYTGNHGNAGGIADLVRLLRNGIRDCGHDPRISHDLMRGHCNILIEHFVEDADLLHAIQNKTPGTHYIVIGTERVTGPTFNTGLVAGHALYGDEDYWKQRFDGFMVVARLADAVWVLAESEVEPYAAVLRDTPVRFLPHAFVEGFEQVEHRAEADKDIDFYFSGTLTAYRTAILEKLGKHAKVLFGPTVTPEYLRMENLSRAKVCLSLRLSPENEIPSVSRMHFHLQNRNFLVHEAYARPCPLDPYVLHAPPDELVDWAHEALRLTNRREIATGLGNRFRQDMPMKRWLQPMLAEAMGEPVSAMQEAPRRAA
jgi:hypothetical protein